MRRRGFLGLIGGALVAPKISLKQSDAAPPVVEPVPVQPAPALDPLPYYVFNGGGFSIGANGFVDVTTFDVKRAGLWRFDLLVEGVGYFESHVIGASGSHRVLAHSVVQCVPGTHALRVSAAKPVTVLRLSFLAELIPF